MGDQDRKRKRESVDHIEGTNTPTEDSSLFSAPEEVVLEDQHFQVKVLKHKNAAKRAKTKPKSKSQTKHKGFGDVKTEVLPGSNAEVPYQIAPGGEWDSLKKYKNFVVQEKTFGIDDYVFIRHNDNVNDLADDGQGWVGKVLEIRARDQTAVFPYHGEKELIMSDWMQIIDAQTVDGKVEIEPLNERKHQQPPTAGYYWRQNLFHLTGKLSDLKTDDCQCGRPNNPDTLLIQCEHCNKWQHELCVKDDVLRKKWESMQRSTTTESGTSHDATTTTGPLTTDLPTPPSVSDTIAVAPANGTPAAASRKRKKAGRKSTKPAAPQTPAWEDVLEGILERDEQSLKRAADTNGENNDNDDEKEEDEEDSDAQLAQSRSAAAAAAVLAEPKITGKVVVTDKRDTSGNREILDAACLHCGASFAADADASERKNGTSAPDGAKTEEVEDKIEVAT